MNRTWKHGLLAMPGVGISMLPKLVCPGCWPAYAALVSSVGLGFLVSMACLLPLVLGFLLLPVFALGFRASKRQGYGPAALGLIGATGILVGKFVWDSNPTVYSAVGLLVIASLWSAWPSRAVLREGASCPECDRDSNASVRLKGIS